MDNAAHEAGEVLEPRRSRSKEGSATEDAVARFPRPPTPAQVEAIRRAIIDTGRPELVPQLDWSKPDVALDHQLYHPKITIPRAMRPGGEMIACPFCSGENPKCLSVYLMWSSDERLRVIGHMCGPNRFGEAGFRDLAREARRAFNKEANTQFLLETLPCLPAWVAELDALIPVCQKIQGARKLFWTDVPTLHAALVNMVREHGGALVILRKASAEGPSGFRSSLGGGEAEYEAISISHLRGAPFLSKHYNPVREFEKMRNGLAPFVQDCGPELSQDDVLEIVINLDDDEGERLAEARKTIEQTQRRCTAQLEKLHETVAFLGPDNLSNLRQWAEHPEADLAFAVEELANGIWFKVDWQERVTLPPFKVAVPTPGSILQAAPIGENSG